MQGNGLPYASITVLKIDPQNPAILYAGQAIIRASIRARMAQAVGE